MQISTVHLSKVKDTSKLFRFDAEYFQPKYLKTEGLIQKHKYSELRDLISVLTDYHANGSYEILSYARIWCMRHFLQAASV